MNVLALLSTCAALGASGGTTMTGQEAPDFIVADWAVKPEVHLRNIRGRKALIFMYHTAC